MVLSNQYFCTICNRPDPVVSSCEIGTLLWLHAVRSDWPYGSATAQRDVPLFNDKAGGQVHSAAGATGSGTRHRAGRQLLDVRRNLAGVGQPDLVAVLQDVLHGTPE